MTRLEILEGGKNGHFKAKAIARLKDQIWPILGLALKFKMLKTYHERLYRHITVVPWNKELESPINISKMITEILEANKNGNFAKVIVIKNKLVKYGLFLG